MTRIEQEIELLRTRFPDLQWTPPWILLPSYPLPNPAWGRENVGVAFSVSTGYPSQKPYAFYVDPRLRVRGGLPGNATDVTEPPFDGSWLKFSWDCEDWRPGAAVSEGTNLLHWALSFHERLRDYS